MSLSNLRIDLHCSESFTCSLAVTILWKWPWKDAANRRLFRSMVAKQKLRVKGQKMNPNRYANAIDADLIAAWRKST
jgi:hypothetical protein